MIYLDNAATTFPKPSAVSKEIYRCMTEYCGNPGRGSHYMARAASEKIFEVRDLLSEMFNCTAPDNVVFTLNTTYAINIALKSFVQDGMHVLISDMEHNSVLRPVAALAKQGRITYSVFNTFGGDKVKLIKSLHSSINANTKILICQHSSNICGTVLPIKEIGELCRKRGIYFIVDAAQSAGVFDIDIKKCSVDALCVPSHKGLYGPQGAGAVIFANNGAIGPLNTFTEGGSGSSSISLLMPDYLPDKFESGTMPTPAISGLCEGIKFVKTNGANSIRSHEEYLCKLMKTELSVIKNVEIYRGGVPSSILLFNLKGKSCTEVSETLDKVGICSRAGLHCAPLAHNTLNTGGAVRISFGAFNDIGDVKYTAKAINAISKDV